MVSASCREAVYFQQNCPVGTVSGAAFLCANPRGLAKYGEQVTIHVSTWGCLGSALEDALRLNHAEP
jgi:hypothetical protein